jgi:hypothetical protein
MNGNPRQWTYWEAVLRFGLPFGIVSLGTDYLVYGMRGGNHAPYPWVFFLTTNVCAIPVVSALWWGFKRGIAVGRRDNQGVLQRCVENAIHWCLGSANYRQAVIRFGLPIVVILRLFNYLMFSALRPSHGARYPALSILKVDVPAVFILSTVWWLFMRFIASRKREG